MKGRTMTDAQKDEALKSRESAPILARKFGVSSNQIYRWRNANGYKPATNKGRKINPVCNNREPSDALEKFIRGGFGV